MTQQKADDPVPVFNSWRGWYILTALVLIIQIGFYYLLTLLFQ